MRARLITVIATIAATVVAGSIAWAATPTKPVTKYHFANNTEDGAAAKIGVNLWDVGIDGSLPAKGKGLVWVGGSYGGCAFSVSDADFRDAVRRLGHEPRIFGWYIWDEPNLEECPGLADRIRARARYVKDHAPKQKVYLVAGGGDGEPVDKRLAPRRYGAGYDIDLYGLDPYPCQIGKACDYSLIGKAVKASRANGVPKTSMLVPTYQGFGQSKADGGRCGDGKWRKPKAAEFTRMFAEWDKYVPKRAFDAVYTWGNHHEESEKECQTVAGDDDLRETFKARFAKP